MIGAGLLGLGFVALAQGWLMPWGLLLWIPVLLLGVVFLCLVGHFLFLLPLFFLMNLFTAGNEVDGSEDRGGREEDDRGKGKG